MTTINLLQSSINCNVDSHCYRKLYFANKRQKASLKYLTYQMNDILDHMEYDHMIQNEREYEHAKRRILKTFALYYIYLHLPFDERIEKSFNI